MRQGEPLPKEVVNSSRVTLLPGVRPAALPILIAALVLCGWTGLAHTVTRCYEDTNPLGGANDTCPGMRQGSVGMTVYNTRKLSRLDVHPVDANDVEPCGRSVKEYEHSPGMSPAAFQNDLEARGPFGINAAASALQAAGAREARQLSTGSLWVEPTREEPP
jgi:hypothetical protein